MESDSAGSKPAEAGAPRTAADIHSMLMQAVAAHQQGRLAAARAGYEEILQFAPAQFDALHLLGVIALQEKNAERGVALIRRAIEANPRQPAAHLNLASGFTDLLRLDEALESLDRAIELKPDYAEAFCNRGHVLTELRRPAEALASCDRAIALKPDQALAQCNRGYALCALGRLAEALQSCDRAIDLKPDYAEAHGNRGNALSGLGRLEEAIASYDRAIALKPDYALACYNRGNVLEALRRLDDALASWDRALALKPDYVLAWLSRGGALQALGRPAEAVGSFDRVIALAPDRADAHTGRSAALLGLDRASEALASCEAAIALAPGLAEAHNNRGIALRTLGRLSEALASFDRAIELKADYANALTNRGNALEALGHADEAIAVYDQAIALKPDSPEAHNNRGNALRNLNRVDEALASFARAIALRPDYASAHWNESLCRLLIGDFERGWRKYEWRWQATISTPHDFPQPLWLGKESLRGRTILLHAEQGLGDTLQFGRYAPLVARLGARVLLLVQPPLKRLFAGMEGVSAVYDGSVRLPAFDCHCPLMSLPLALATDLASIPAAVPYLHADPARARRWKERLTGEEVKVGLVWAGASRRNDIDANTVDRRRSLALSQFASLAEVPGVRFVSLQKGEPSEQARVPPPRMALADYTVELNDFADTAALVSALDLVISVDTSVAHLAGGMGKPVWILSRFDCCWRWLLDRDDSPWYPSARLFRQGSPGDWVRVIERVAAALREWRHDARAINA